MIIRCGINCTSTILVVALIVGTMCPNSVQAQESYALNNVQSDVPITRAEIISLLELQYQVTLNLPYSPTTEASLTALDMAIAGVSSASPEQLVVLQTAGPSLRVLMADMRELNELVSADQGQADLAKSSGVESQTATFDCDPDGFIELEGESVRPPGYCNQSDTQVRGIDYLPFGADGKLDLSDNVYPNYPFCGANVSPLTTQVLLHVALTAEVVAAVADSSCSQGTFFFFSGSNFELLCIVTDLIKLAAQNASDGAQFCNGIRSASEGRTTYVRAGELFVQSSENTEFIDTQLIDGFNALNGEIGNIRDRACDNAVLLNQQIEQLNETLRSVRISDARLLNLFGDQLDPIDPVPLPTPDCVPQAIAAAVPTTQSDPPPEPTDSTDPDTALPPSIQPAQSEDEPAPRTRTSLFEEYGRVRQ